MNMTKATLLGRTAMGLALLAALTIPSACSVIYTSPKVSKAAGTNVDVREIELTPETVLLANRTAYSPRNLPKEFFTAASGGQARGFGALPDKPYVPKETPQQMQLRVPPETQTRPYEIGVGDVVLLATKDSGNSVEQLSGLLAAQTKRQGYTVSDDGAISIPNIGRVKIAGLTLTEAQDAIFKFLLDKQVDPAFSLEVTGFNSKKVTVGGNVRNPARIPITLNPLTLGDAVTAAGGLEVRDKEFASIRIYRDGELYQVPLQDYLARPNLQEIHLVDGDAVFVDTTYDLDRAFEFYKQEIDVIRLRDQARKDALDMLKTEFDLRRSVLDEKRSNFTAREKLGAESRDYIYLTGEVSEQNRVPLPYEQQATLADVLYGNGGFPTMTGNASNIYVLRPSANPADFGAITAWHLNARNAVNMTLATKMQMRPNDIVFIEEQPITKWGRAFQQFLPALLNTAGRAATN